MFHEVKFLGSLGNDPVMKYMPDGTALCHFSVAASNGYGEKKKTIWFRCTAWRWLAEQVNQYLSKGDKVLVTGVLSPDENGNPRVYTKANGDSGASFEVNVNSVVFVQTSRNKTMTTQIHEDSASENVIKEIVF